MKKRIISIVLSVVIALVAFTGCGLTQDNPKRVSEQALVTVGYGENQQVVTRGEVVRLYNANGYLYVNLYQMSVNEVLNMMVNNIVNEKIVTYAALENLKKITPSTSKDKNALYDQYLTTAEINDIAIKVDVDLSGQIDKLETEALRKTAGIEAPKYKITPTAFVFSTAIPSNFVGTTSRNSAVAQLKRNLASNDLTLEEFLNKQMVSYKQEAVVKKYTAQIKNEVTVSDEDILVRYNTLLDKENEQFAISPETFAKKLDTISDSKLFSGDNFVISIPQLGHGFVHSILLKYNDEQQAKYDAWEKEVDAKTLTEAEFEAKKKELLKEVTATDNRIDWLKEYGTKTELFDAYAFDGKFTEKKIDGVQIKDIKGEYAYDDLKSNSYTVDEFMTKVQSELHATKANTIDGFQIYNTNNQKDKFLNMLWAYGDDPGMENNQVGYRSTNTGFVAEYTKAAKAVVKGGVGSYTLVESPKYGYFVVYCSNAYNNVGKNEYISGEKDKAGTFSNIFYNEVNTSLKTNYYEEKTARLSAEYLKDSKFMVIKESVFKSIFDSITK